MPEDRLYLDHPCFFVCDAATELAPSDIPELEDREPPLVWTTVRVLAVGTIAAVDGKVHIILDRGPELKGSLAFSGSLLTPSGAIVVTQSSTEEILRMTGLGSVSRVDVGVDDLRFPTCIHLIIR